MDIRKRIIGSSALTSRNGEIIGIDLDLLIQRLLLFDGYVLKTVRFKEIPFLLQAFGYDQALELLNCGLIEIRCEVLQIGSVREQELKKQNRLAYDLVWIQAHDWEKYVFDCLGDVRAQVRLPGNKWQALERAVRDRIRRIDEATNTHIGQAFTNSLDNFPAVVSEAVRFAAKRQRTPLVLPNFRVELERQDGHDLMFADTNLRYTRIPREEVWTIVRDGLMAVGTLEQNIGEMQGHEAIGGFAPAELPLYEARLSGLARLANPEDAERRTLRILKVAGLPRFDAQSVHFKLDRLLEARTSDELRIFRDWLPESDKLSDTEIKTLVKGFRARVATFLRGGSASMSRLMVEAGLGVFSAIGGVALSALDYFLLEHVLPSRGPAAFINKVFPSLFEKQNYRGTS